MHVVPQRLREAEWSKLPPDHDPISAELRHKIDAWVKDMKAKLATGQVAS